MHTTLYSKVNIVRISHLLKSKKHPTFNISPSGISTTTMRKQETDTNQPPTGFPTSKPTMDGPSSSQYGNPLTFNVVVMFLFYVLSITLCLSSVSTCVCIIFNPVGAFLTITGYIFYALVLSLLLTFLTIPFIGLYFDNPAESRKTTDFGQKKPILKSQHEMSAPEAMLNVIPMVSIQEGHPADSPTRELKEPMLTEEAFYKVLAPLVHEAECERLGRASLVKADEYNAKPNASDERVFIPRLQQVLGSKIGTGTDERIKKQFSKKQILKKRFLENLFLKKRLLNQQMFNKRFLKKQLLKKQLPKKQLLKTANDAAGSTEPAIQINLNVATTFVETAVPIQDSATMSTQDLTTRGSTPIDQSIDRTTLPPPTTTKTNAADEDSSINTHQNIRNSLNNLDGSDSPSKPHSLVLQDSKFRIALHGYMNRGVSGGREQRRSRSCYSSSRGEEESEFQGLVRRTFGLERGRGGKGEKRARSAGW